MNEKKSVTRKASTAGVDQLIGELKVLMTDAEALIEATEGHLDGAIGAIRTKAQETLADVKESIACYEDVLIDHLKELALQHGSKFIGPNDNDSSEEKLKVIDEKFNEENKPNDSIVRLSSVLCYYLLLYLPC